MESAIAASFLKLRPICVAIAKDPTLDLISELIPLIRNLPDDHMQHLHEYVLLPLVNVFRKPLKRQEDVCTVGAAAIRAVLECCTIGSFDVFQDLIAVLFFSLNPPSATHFAAKAEECVDEIVCCITTLLRNTNTGVLLQFYDAGHLPAIGHGVSTLLSVIENSLSRRLKAASLECLSELSQSRRPGNDGVRSRASKCFASFLPGVVLTLSKVITGDSKIGHKVVTSSIDLWSDIVALVMADDVCPDERAAGADDCCLLQAEANLSGVDEQTSASRPAGVANRGRHLAVKRTASWTDTTSEKLHVLLKAIGDRPSRHASHLVRLSVARLADKCLTACARSLARSTQTLLEVLLGLVGDEQPSVASFCREALERFADRPIPPASARDRSLGKESEEPSQRHSTLIELLEDNIFVFAQRLPRLLQQPDDDARLATLRLLRGYIHVLGSRTNRLLNSSVHLQRLTKAFSQVLELSCSSLQLLCEATPSTIPALSAVESTEDGRGCSVEALASGCRDCGREEHEQNGLPSSVPQLPAPRHEHSKLWRQFKHFHDERVWKELSTCCRLLGSFGSVVVLVDHLLDLMNESSRYEKEAGLILNEVIRGFSSTLGGTLIDEQRLSADTSNVANGVAGDIVREYVEKLNSAAASRSQAVRGAERTKSRYGRGAEGSDVSTALLQANSDVLFTCILLDGLAAAFAIGSSVNGSGYEHLLMESLYVILDHLSDETLVVSNAAYAALEDITRVFGYGSVSQLLFRHADYIVNSLSLKLRRLNYYPRAPLVLRAVIQHGDKTILPYLEDVILDVVGIIDYTRDEHAVRMILRVLIVLLNSICSWYGRHESVVDQKEKISKKGLKSTGSFNCQASQGFVPGAVADWLHEYCRQKREAADGDLTDDFESHGYDDSGDAALSGDGVDSNTFEKENEAEAASDDTVSTEKPDPPPALHVMLANKVLERCSHLVSHDSDHVRIAAIKTANCGFRVLQEAENVLLPAVHKLWAPLVSRYSDPEPAVILAAFECLRTLAELSKDFIRHRFSKEVLPRLCSFLASQSAISMKAGPAYKYTTSYRLQRALLMHIGSIVLDADISAKDFDVVCSACLHYLSCRQPIQLQEQCLLCFTHLASVDANAVWLRLKLTHCDQIPQPPNKHFCPVKFFATCHVPQALEYSQNVGRLLQTLDAASG